MNSTEQAFVKAFARRKPTADAGQPPAVERPANESDSQGVDRNVERTAKVWLDPMVDPMARADQAELEVPRPHLESHALEPQQAESLQAESSQVATEAKRTGRDTEQLVASLQHIHTAYATAAPWTLPTAVDADPSPVAEEPTGPSDSSYGVQSYSTTEWETGHRGAEQVVDDGKPVAETIETRVDPPQSALDGPHLIKPFQAVWEVDVFDVPTTVADLFFGGELFQQISERMSDAVSDGLKTMLITSTKTGEGRSSVAIGMAMAAAAAGVRVALVDADLESPTLADDLRLDLQHGWVDTIRRGLQIKEVAVHAIEDGVTLIPLMPQDGSAAASASETVQLIELLKDKFELIIVDGPGGSSSSLDHFVVAVDSAIIVRDASRTDSLAVHRLSSRLRESGVQGIGLVENFAASGQVAG